MECISVVIGMTIIGWVHLPKIREFEIKKSIEFISAVGSDINNWSVCYPYGDYNDDTIN